jgi:ABC-type antimicrobial peptide transport system permease subunit
VFRIGQDNSPKTVVVIGVVRGVKTGLRDAPRPQVYLPLRQQFVPRVIVAARTIGGQRVAGEIRQVVASLDRNLPVLNAQTLQEAIRFALLPQRLSAIVSGGLGLVGLLLATMGIYGVTAYAVAQRTREIGIRMSLGATPGAVVGMVLRFGMSLVAVGAVVGLLLSAALNAVLTNVFFGFPPADAVAFGASAVLFAVVGLAACYVPVRRATRIDPVVVLRND